MYRVRRQGAGFVVIVWCTGCGKESKSLSAVLMFGSFIECWIVVVGKVFYFPIGPIQ